MADHDNLQFDRLEPAVGAAAASGRMACSNCGSLLESTYFTVNTRVVCLRCRSRILADWNRGGSAGRFGKALVLGILATILCSLIWYAVLKATEAQWGILAVIVGLVVGSAVRKGSNGRGGWRYQTLAIFLTYTAIVTSYVPFILEGIRNERTRPATQTAVTPASDPAVAPASNPPDNAPATDSAVVTSLKKAGPLGIGIGIAVLLALLYATPFLAGIENVLGIVIIGFALYEAWKLNRRTVLQVSGPHQVSMTAARA